jgi:hypothetical protein
MHGDFSRDSFDPKLNFARVLMQQGRLIVDADWNEQSAILLHYMRTLAADLIGWHGGPDVVHESAAVSGPPAVPAVSARGPFVVALDNGKLAYNPGRYYVDGFLCEHEQLSTQDVTMWPHAITINDDAADPATKNFLVYLDVWQRFVCASLDPNHLSDPALQGLDTSGRLETVCAVRMVKAFILENDPKLADRLQFRTLKFMVKTATGDVATSIGTRAPASDLELPRLIAWTNRESESGEDCDDDANTGYTGLENQLYRVEVHHEGADGVTFWDGSELDPKTKDPRGAFTLKWSRDNGSIVFAATAGTTTARLKTKWRDDSRAIRKGDLVELITSSSETGTIVSVTSVQDDNGVITIEFAQPEKSAFKPEEPIIIRRWDHRSRKSFPVSVNGGFLVKEQLDENKQKTGDSIAISIEDGIFVRLSLGKDGDVRKLQAGDYWLIPARAAVGDVIWPPDPTDSSKPKAVPARYTEHHYAPIALIKGSTIVDLRRNVKGIAEPA